MELTSMIDIHCIICRRMIECTTQMQSSLQSAQAGETLTRFDVRFLYNEPAVNMASNFDFVRRSMYPDIILEANPDVVVASETQPINETNTDNQPKPIAGRQPSVCQKLSVVIPVYNERWTVETIVKRVLATDLSLELEVIIVDDGSSDGSATLLERLAAEDSRLHLFTHTTNRGKGAALRTGIQHMTGDVAVIQDADLEYDPADLATLLAPIMEGKADAVYGSRFVGHPRRVLFFWHSLANWFLTLMSNMVNDMNLTDMETCYKMIRTDIFKRLRLRASSFNIEPEITCRLAQWGARVYEVPISYSGRTYLEGKKIGAKDGFKALWEMFRCKVVDPRFTDHSGFYILLSVARATRYNRWILGDVQRFLGKRLLEAGAGIGNLSAMLINRERLVMVDYEEEYVGMLAHRFGWRPNVRVEQGDLTKDELYDEFAEEKLDTVLCSNVLEHLENDRDVLRNMHRVLEPAGHCIILVPAVPWLHNGIDRELGHCRRYTKDELRKKMTEAGFEVVMEKQFSRLAAISWAISGNILRRRHLSPRQMIWFDRIVPLAKLLEYCIPFPGVSLVMVGKKSSSG